MVISISMYKKVKKKRKILIALWVICFLSLNNLILDVRSKTKKEENSLTKYFPYAFTSAVTRKGKNVKKANKLHSFVNHKIANKKTFNTNKNRCNCFCRNIENKKIFYNIKERQRNEKKRKHSFALKSHKCNRYRSTKEGKNEMIRKIKRFLKPTKLLLQLNGFKITPNLRMEALIHMPRPHVRLHMIKNTLMKIAVCNTPFQGLIPYLKGSNLYLFIMNEKYISFTLYQMKIFNSLYKEFKTNNSIKLSIYENTILTKKETEDLINLKTKEAYFANVINKIKDVITNIPSSILQIPSSIARGIYLNTQKKQEN